MCGITCLLHPLPPPPGCDTQWVTFHVYLGCADNVRLRVCVFFFQHLKFHPSAIKGRAQLFSTLRV